jgi:hypothetical protein
MSMADPPAPPRLPPLTGAWCSACYGTRWWANATGRGLALLDLPSAAAPAGRSGVNQRPAGAAAAAAEADRAAAAPRI